MKHLKWSLVALVMVLPLLFVILCWQLYSLDPDAYCGIVKQQGVPAGNFCFQLLTEGLKIKGWTIWLLIGTICAFILIVLVTAVKALVTVSGPNGISLTIKGDSNAS